MPRKTSTMRRRGAKKQEQPYEMSAEHSADVKEAAKAIESKPTETKKRAPAARTDQKVIDRAVELRKEGLGLVKLTAKLTEEGFKSATAKELRPQTVRQLLLRALNTDHLREEKPQETPDIKEALKESVEKARPSRKTDAEAERKKKVAEGIGI